MATAAAVTTYIWQHGTTIGAVLCLLALVVVVAVVVGELAAMHAARHAARQRQRYLTLQVPPATKGTTFARTDRRWQ